MHGEEAAGREDRDQPGAVLAEEQQPAAGDDECGGDHPTGASSSSDGVQARCPDTEGGYQDTRGGAAGPGQPPGEAQIAGGEREAAAQPGGDKRGGAVDGAAAEGEQGESGEREPNGNERRWTGTRAQRPLEGFG